MSQTEVYTIEVNLNAPCNHATSWHVDRADRTFATNIQHCLDGHHRDKWVVVALADSFIEALRASSKLMLAICEKLKLEPVYLPLSEV